MNKKYDYIPYIEAIKSHRKKKYVPLRNTANQTSHSDGLEIPVRLLPYLLDICPIGDGPLYETFVSATLVNVLDGIIDQDLVRRQVPIQGGFADIELPFCSEMIPEYPHWAAWQREYKIKTILAEVKNLRKKAAHEDTIQLKGYVDGNQKGSLAFLVSRSGFTKDALKTLRSYAYSNYLLLPLEHDDLRELIKLSLDSPVKVLRYLRRKETLLLRMK